MKFSVERYLEIRNEIRPLLEEHWREMPFDPELPLDPDESAYAAADHLGRLHVLVARDDAGRIVGYFVAFLSRHPHYAILTAAMDIYYLAPEHRAGANGIALFMEFERTAHERGARFLLATARLDRDPAAARLFERLGWTQARMVYQKRLKD